MKSLAYSDLGDSTKEENDSKEEEGAGSRLRRRF